jgi:hypothetical protein
MTPAHASPAQERERITTYTIAARTFTGTPDEAARELDEVIESLAAARDWLLRKTTKRRDEVPRLARRAYG